jgi:hypothetical protein
MISQDQPITEKGIDLKCRKQINRYFSISIFTNIGNITPH